MPLPPFKIKVVEPVNVWSRETRLEQARRAGFNLFQIPARYVSVDLLTDSGTSAMSDRQWGGMMRGDESYAGSENYYHLERAVREIFGFRHVIPTHQGRAAEHLLFSVMVRKGHVIPSNHHFDTTRANLEVAGGEAVDLAIPESADLGSTHPFKGNIDLERVGKLVHDRWIAFLQLQLQFDEFDLAGRLTHWLPGLDARSVYVDLEPAAPIAFPTGLEGRAPRSNGEQLAQAAWTGNLLESVPHGAGWKFSTHGFRAGG